MKFKYSRPFLDDQWMLPLLKELLDIRDVLINGVHPQEIYMMQKLQQLSLDDSNGYYFFGPTEERASAEATQVATNFVILLFSTSSLPTTINQKEDSSGHENLNTDFTNKKRVEAGKNKRDPL